jgi:hypothetical protein
MEDYMGRLVTARIHKPPMMIAAAAESPVKEHLERISKFIPSEIIGGYLTITNVVIGPGAGQSSIKCGISIATFMIGVVGTPIYFKLMAKQGDAIKSQCVLSTIAFIIWAYTLGGWINELGLYQKELAGAALVVFSILSGFFPRPVTPNTASPVAPAP